MDSKYLQTNVHAAGNKQLIYLPTGEENIIRVGPRWRVLRKAALFLGTLNLCLCLYRDDGDWREKVLLFHRRRIRKWGVRVAILK